MADLVSRIAGFINLPKAAQVSVPGVLLAIGIVLCYYAGGRKPMEASVSLSKKEELPALSQCQGLDKVKSLESGSGRPTQEDFSYLQARQTSLLDCSQKLQAEVIRQEKDVAALTASIAAHQKAADDLIAQYIDFAKKGNSLAQHYRGLATAELGVLNDEKRRSQAGASSIAAYKAFITSLEAERTSIMDRLKAGEQDSPLADFSTKLTDHLLYVLIGTVLGFVIDPITAFVLTLAYTDGRFERLNLGFDGYAPVPTSANRQSIDNINYALGMGTITNADVESVRNRYGVAAQFGAGLILPTIVFLIAAGRFLDSHPAYAPSFVTMPSAIASGTPPDSATKPRPTGLTDGR